MLVSRIKKAVVAARNDAEKVTARRGCAVAPPWLTSNLREPAFKDDTISWIRFDRTDGSRKAYIVNFACHSETLWKRNTLISADYPGELCKILEDNTGAAPIFFQGACGGKVTPNLEDEASLPDRVQYMKEIGEVISDRIIRSESASARMDDVSIAHSQRKVSIRLENRTFGMLRTIGVLKRKGGAATIESEINMIRIGDTLMFGAPGELLPSVGSMIKGRLAMSPSVMILGLCCDELGYILSAEEFEKPQYEFERSLCAGRNVTQEILKSVYELRARL
jgi:hypothetical protein